MFNAMRSIIAVIAALLLAGAGLAFLVWLLRWLWEQREETAAPPAIEIEAKVPAGEGELLAVGAEEELPATEVDVLDVEAEEELPTTEVDVLDVEAEEELPATQADVPDVEAEEEVPVEEVELPAGDVEGEVSTAEEPPVLPAPDDLKRIEGIGPKIASVLQAAGVTTFAQLADTDADQLRRILEEADPRLLRLAHPVSWPEQASLAAAGNWDALEALQAELKAGRKR